MPSIRDHMTGIDKAFEHVQATHTAIEGPTETDSGGEAIQQLKVAVAQLGAMCLQTVTRYDYWRRTYCAKTQMSESDFDAMTDECIMHEGEPEAECQHLVVNTIGRCANCGKRP
jgi:hypothetical protein